MFATTALVAGLGLSGAGLAPAPARDGREGVAPTRLEVDLSERKLYLYHDGEVVNTYDVAVGDAEHPTPEGEFTINRIIWNPGWVPPHGAEWAEDKEEKKPNDSENPMVGAKLFFEYPDYYIHGTDAPHTLGEAESHGCIRMHPDEVKDLAEWVQEHGGKPRDDGWFSWVARDDDSSHEITLPAPVAVTIRD
ncbi:MAG: L,D-transpeptidase [Gemmatimonadetes bacterium]|nr:L,D-transpeptidase [Gemmatimonadota bacterium]